MRFSRTPSATALQLALLNWMFSLGWRAVRMADRSRDRNIRRVGPGRDPQLAHSEAAGQFNLADEFRKPIEDPLAVAQNDFAEDRRRDAAPIDELNAKGLLDRLEAARQGRLRNAQSLRREREAFMRGEGFHDLDLAGGQQRDTLKVNS